MFLNSAWGKIKPRHREAIAEAVDAAFQFFCAGRTSHEIGTHTPIWLQDWRVKPGASVTIDIEPGFNAAAYVFDGQILFSTEGVPVARSQMALFGAGGRLKVKYFCCLFS